jgi:hypothetical protein
MDYLLKKMVREETNQGEVFGVKSAMTFHQILTWIGFLILSYKS